jgi:RNA polymerase sigma factor (sigma-70 family)
MSLRGWQALLHCIRGIASPQDDRVPDAELLQRLVSGRDEAAFTALFSRHGPLVLGTCRRILWHDADVEDAFQATFLVLLRKAPGISQRKALSGWLHKVATRTACLARKRAYTRRCHEQASARPADAAVSSADPLAHVGSVLDEEVNRLPEKYRLPVVLCYLQGQTNAEAARLLGCPTGTVFSRLATARERLRQRLTRRGVSASALALVLTPAGVPEALAAATVQALAGTGTAIAPPGVVMLVEGVLRSMALENIQKAAVPLLIVLGLLAVGVALLGGRVEGDGPPTAPKAPAQRPTEAATDPAERFVGTWERHDQFGGEQVWKITRRDGQWAILVACGNSGHRIEASGRVWASFQGRDFQVANDRLTFRQQYIKQPPGYDDGNPVALKLSGEQLVVGDEAKVPLARAGDGRELLGTWTGPSARAGFRETWTIQKDKAAVEIVLDGYGGEKATSGSLTLAGFSVVGTVTRDGEEVGSFRGKSAHYFLRTLSFTQEFDKLPPGWDNGTTITATGRRDQLDCNWQLGDKKGGRRLSKTP